MNSNAWIYWMWGLALIRIDRAPPWIFSLKELILNSQKKKKKGCTDTSVHPVSGIFGEEFTLPDPGWSVWEEFHLVLTAEGCAVQVHTKFTASTQSPFCTLSHSLMAAGRWATPAWPATRCHGEVTAARQKKKMKQINSGVSYGEDPTAAQHDNDHKSTQALRQTPERRFFKWMWVSMID